jgi:cytochrome c oxidase subunit 4
MSDHSHATEADDGQVHAHISPVWFYALILGVLMFFTLLTVGVSYVHLGKLNLLVAIVIASIKAALVVTFFMHLKYDNKINALIMVVSLLFIGVFFTYTMNDTEHRGLLDNDQGGRVSQTTGLVAPGGMEPAAAHDEAEHPAAAGTPEHAGDKPAEHAPEHAPEHH